MGISIGQGVGVDHFMELDCLHDCQLIGVPYPEGVVGTCGCEHAGVVRIPLHLGHCKGSGGRGRRCGR